MHTKIKMNFDVSVAKDVGSDCAIILENIEFWQEKNRVNNRHFYEDRYWTYNSVRAWLEFFPWLTENKMRTCFEKLEKKQYIITGVFNKAGYDRTKWYTSTRLSNKPLPKVEKKPKAKSTFKAPLLQEIKEYKKEINDKKVDAEYFLKFYTTSNWKKANGKPVKNWKQTFLTWTRNSYEQKGNYDTRKSDLARIAEKNMRHREESDYARDRSQENELLVKLRAQQKQLSIGKRV